MKKRLLIFGVVALVAVVALLGWLRTTTGKRYAYSGPGRDEWQQPQRVLEALALKTGDAVADIGSGGGYFTFRFADAVGREGRVYAVDVDPDMIRYVAGEAQKRGLGQIQTIPAAPDSAGLPANSVDLVFLANTYHHIQNRAEYFRALAPSLRPRARIAIVEFKAGGWISRFFGHATDAETMRAEMSAAGYDLAESFDFLERQHFMIFSLREK